jgi:hypothetical protein
VTPLPAPRQFIQSNKVQALPESVMINNGRLISVEITWNHGGNVVSVVGSWNNWQYV